MMAQSDFKLVKEDQNYGTVFELQQNGIDTSFGFFPPCFPRTKIPKISPQDLRDNSKKGDLF